MATTKHWVEMRPGAPWDLEASGAASILSAYGGLEDARRWRRRLTAAGIVVAAASAIEALIGLVIAPAVVTALVAAVCTVGGALVNEWRAERKLTTLTGAR